LVPDGTSGPCPPRSIAGRPQRTDGSNWDGSRPAGRAAAAR